MRTSTRVMTTEGDWWVGREFILDVWPLSPPGHTWEIRRWDGNAFHREKPLLPEFLEAIRVWEVDGSIVGIAHQEGTHDVALQVHPDHRALDEPMIEWAEFAFTKPGPDGIRVLHTDVFDYDDRRAEMLARRGWERLETGIVSRRLKTEGRMFTPGFVASPYEMRTANPDDLRDAGLYAELLNAAFGRSIHTDIEVQAFRLQSPSYSDDLDLVAAAPDGALAAAVGITFDERNRAGIVEPVCTHPDHRRKGLAIELIREGLRRLEERGAETVWVDTGLHMDANALYERAGFDEPFVAHTWRFTD